jgi:predicted secreted Zn-dependent protease
LSPVTYLRLSIVLAACGLWAACSNTPSTSQSTAPTVEIQADAPVAASTPSSAVPSPSPAAGDRIKVASTTSTTLYTVEGSTADQIFAYMEAYGPVDDRGGRGTGVTLYKSQLIWDTNRDPRSCAIASMTIKVDVQVMLPNLDNPGRLPAIIQSYWKKFADGVAAHEQRHVDIYLKGAETMRQKMAALPPAAGCSLLESAVYDVWTSQQALTDQEQDRFHQDERARIEAARAPLKQQVDANKSRLDSLNSQIAGIDAGLATLAAQADSLRRLLDSLKSQIQALDDRYAGASMPPDILRQYQSLTSQYSNLVPGYNALIDQYNGLVGQRNALTTQYEDLRAQTAALVEQYAWSQ